MYVCICKGVTDKQVRAAIAAGASSVEELGDRLGVGRNCGGCTDFAAELLGEHGLEQNLDSSLFYSPA